RAGLSRPVARRLFRSSHLTRLTELDVGPGLTVPATAQEVVHSRVFQRLKALGWRNDAHQGRGAMLAELAPLADPPPLRKLDLSSNRITPDQIDQLANAPVMSAVEHLDLCENGQLGP